MATTERLGASPTLRPSRPITPGREVHHDPEEPAFSLEEAYARWGEIFPTGPVKIDPITLLPYPFHEHQTEERKTNPPIGIRSLLHVAGFTGTKELDFEFRKTFGPSGPFGREPVYKFGFSWSRGETPNITFNRFNVSLREHVWNSGSAIWVGDGPISSFELVDDSHPRIPAPLDTTTPHGHLLHSFERLIGRQAGVETRSMVATDLISVVHPQGFKPKHYPFAK